MLYDNFAKLCADVGLTPTKFTTDIIREKNKLIELLMLKLEEQEKAHADKETVYADRKAAYEKQNAQLEAQLARCEKAIDLKDALIERLLNAIIPEGKT